MPVELVIRLLAFYFSDDANIDLPAEVVSARFLFNLRGAVPVPFYMMAEACKKELCEIIDALQQRNVRFPE